MNQNDDKNKKDPNEQDPFNFFKLSPEPPNNNPNNDKDKKNPRLPLFLLRNLKTVLHRAKLSK